jgi:drug/metabolite transporter (DMT)-like permease
MTAIATTAPAGAPASPDEQRLRAGRTPHVERPLRGVLLVGLAVFLFACNDILTKYLVTSYSVPLVTAVRYTVHLLLMVAILGPRDGRQLVTTRRTGLVVVRSLCLVAGTLCMGFGLQLMPVAEAVTIVYLAPLLVVLLARPLLGERIGLVGWLACFAGLGGVLLILRPGGGLDPLGIVFVLCTMCTSVIYSLLSRVLALTERTSTLMFYVALAGTICFGIMLPWSVEGAAPTLPDILLFLSLGATAASGHFLYTAAHRDAPASLLAPVSYMQLIWIGILSWLVLGTVPDGLTIVGMLVVAGAGVAIALRSARSARKAPMPVEAPTP